MFGIESLDILYMFNYFIVTRVYVEMYHVVLDQCADQNYTSFHINMYEL